MAEIPGCTTCGAKPTPFDPSARARSPFASTSTASTRLPARAAIRATAAVTVLFPVPPLPATNTTRRCSSSSTTRAVEGARLRVGGDSLEHLGGVTGCLDPTPLVFHSAVGADQESAPFDPHVRARHEFLLPPDAERFDEDTLGVTDQGDSQGALPGESIMALRRVGRHAEHVDAARAKLGVELRELLALDGAAGRVVLGIKEQDSAPPTKTVAAHALADAG